MDTKNIIRQKHAAFKHNEAVAALKALQLKEEKEAKLQEQEEQEQEIQQCKAQTFKGIQCCKIAQGVGFKYCHLHTNYDPEKPPETVPVRAMNQCMEINREGKRCEHNTFDTKTLLCAVHKKAAEYKRGKGRRVRQRGFTYRNCYGNDSAKLNSSKYGIERKGYGRR
jgi:hypothetical protein